jgi:signal transduction histidine kinase
MKGPGAKGQSQITPSAKTKLLRWLITLACGCMVVLNPELHFAKAQVVSRIDSKRVHYQEQNARALDTMATSTSLSSELTGEQLEKYLSNKAIRDDTTLPCKPRLAAQWSLVQRRLYRDTRNSRQELDNYIKLAWEFRDSSAAYGLAQGSLGFYHRKMGNYDSARMAFEEELAFSRQHNHQTYILDARIDLCVLMEDLGQYEEAIVEYEDILDTCLAWGRRHSEARCRLNLGELYTMKGDYSNAFVQLNEALDLCTIYNEHGFMASAYRSLGDLNRSIGNYPVAEEHYVQSLKWADRNNNAIAKRKAVMQLSVLREKQGRLPEAIQLSRSLLAFGVESGLRLELAEDEFHLAELFRKNKMLDSALLHIGNSLSIYAHEKVRSKYYKALGIAGAIHSDLGHVTEAEKYCLASYEMPEAKSDQIQQAANCRCLYDVHKEKGNEALALKYLEEFLDLEHLLSDREAALELVRQQMNLDFKYRQYRDSLAAREQLVHVELENAEALRNRQRLLLTLSIGFALVMLVALVIWRAYRINLRQKNDLDRLNRLNKQIFSIISHDFKGPLTSLRLVSDTLSDTSADAETMRMWLKDIRSEISQTSNLLDSLVNWARAELSINLTDKPQTNITGIASELKQVFEPQLKEKELELELRLPTDALLPIHPELMRILLRNLISNAIKFSRPGGRITLAYDPSYKEIMVRDTGVGMTPEAVSKLLQGPVHSRLGTENESGFGMGLYITSELLRKIGWSVAVTSKLGEGTTVFVRTNA